MDPTMRLPASVIDELDAQAAGTRQPAPLREAASVILLRDGDAGLELFLMLRHTTMAFASGMAVFPGGGVDKRDFEDAPSVVGPGLDEWAGVLGTSPLMAGAVLCAAIRGSRRRASCSPVLPTRSSPTRIPPSGNRGASASRATSCR